MISAMAGKVIALNAVFDISSMLSAELTTPVEQMVLSR